MYVSMWFNSHRSTERSIAYSAMGAVLRLIKGPHPQTTDMTGRMIARSNRMVGNRIGTNKADVGIIVSVSRGRRSRHASIGVSSLALLLQELNSCCCSGGGNVLGCWVGGSGIDCGLSISSSASSSAPAAASSTATPSSSRALVAAGLRCALGSRHSQWWVRVRFQCENVRRNIVDCGGYFSREGVDW